MRGKKIVLGLLAIGILLAFSGCECKHEWEDATAEPPMVCMHCGEVEENPAMLYYVEEFYDETIRGQLIIIGFEGNLSGSGVEESKDEMESDGLYKVKTFALTSETDVVIPETIDGKTVLGIDAGAFDNCHSIKSITIPSNVLFEPGVFVEGCAKDLVIYGSEGSAAEDHAKRYNIDFIAID